MIVRFLRALGLVSAAVSLGIGGCSSSPVSPEARQALAPTGKLRVGVYPGSPSSMLKDPSGEDKGITIDLGRALAARLGVPYEQVEFARVAEVLEGLKAGRIDFTFTNATAARAQEMDFAAPIVDIELGYLVLAGSPVTSVADVDRAGIRVGVTQGGTSHRVLPARFKNATVVPASSLKVAVDLMKSRKIDTYATNKPILYEMADQLPNSKVLDGQWGVEHLAIAIPKGREAGLAFVRGFSEDAKANGLVKRAVERSGMRGVAY